MKKKVFIGIVLVLFSYLLLFILNSRDYANYEIPTMRIESGRTGRPPPPPSVPRRWCGSSVSRRRCPCRRGPPRRPGSRASGTAWRCGRCPRSGRGRGPASRNRRRASYRTGSCPPRGRGRDGSCPRRRPPPGGTCRRWRNGARTSRCPRRR